MAKPKGALQSLSESETAELSRALRLYIAVANFKIRVIKARSRKDINPEHDSYYQEATEYLNRAAEALEKITNKLRQRT
jgi:hypothetical protein